MAASSRTAQFTRLHKILKKHYTAVHPDPNRSVLEHLLFASCLENAHFRAAEEAFAALVHTFFDWNEVRVSSVRELSEAISGLPDPAAAAHRVKRILQSVFEASYSFDLEDLRKQNLGPAVERLEKTEGTSKFSIAYVIQSALGGHAIPIDSGTANAMHVVGLASEEDVAAGTVPGLDRAVPKNSGVEFGALLHQLGADFATSPYSPALHGILLEIEPKAKENLPSRRGPKRPAKEPQPAPKVAHEPAESKSKKGPPEAKAPVQKSSKPPAEVKPILVDVKKEATAAKTAAIAKESPKESAREPVAEKKKSATTKKKAEETPTQTHSADVAEPARKKDKEKEKGEESAAAKKKPPAPPKSAMPKKKSDDGRGKSHADQGGEHLGVEGIAKRKPR